MINTYFGTLLKVSVLALLLLLAVWLYLVGSDGLLSSNARHGKQNLGHKVDHHFTQSGQGDHTSPAPSSLNISPFIVSDPSMSVICHTFSSGRLGNHLFEYASILGIAEATNKTFYFMDDGLLIGALKYPPVQTDHEVMIARCHAAKRLQERTTCQYDRKLIDLVQGQDYTIGDNLQSWMYFDAIREEMKSIVTFSDSIVKEATEVTQILRRQFPDTLLIGVHVRRGDIIKLGDGCLTASRDFFRRAMRFFRAKFSRVTFIVLTEPVDTQWCVDNVKENNTDVVVLKTRGSAAVDMHILSLTDHMIRSVGSYGWWAAFKIAGRPTVVYLAEFTAPNSVWSKKYTPYAADYMLPGWLPM